MSTALVIVAVRYSGRSIPLVKRTKTKNVKNKIPLGLPFPSSELHHGTEAE
jgi:hypothetical protein